MYKTVYDLYPAEMDELKQSFFWQDETQDILQGAFESPEQIPDEIILEHYSGVCFTDNDFFCNIEGV